ncbi:hypothetical protein Aduo_011720 [Ancylostoma duodenale]
MSSPPPPMKIPRREASLYHLTLRLPPLPRSPLRMSRDPYEQLSRSPVDSADHEESRIVGDEDGSPRRDAVDDREGALEPVQSRNSGEQEADDYEGLV